MPISPENKHRYPKDWREIRQRVKENAGYTCQHCGIPDRIWGYPTTFGYFQTALPLFSQFPFTTSYQVKDEQGDEIRISQIILSGAHLDHQPEHNWDNNLRALCQRCHLKHDRVHHLRSRFMSPGQLLLKGLAS